MHLPSLTGSETEKETKMTSAYLAIFISCLILNHLTSTWCHQAWQQCRDHHKVRMWMLENSWWPIKFGIGSGLAGVLVSLFTDDWPSVFVAALSVGCLAIVLHKDERC